jgi:CYTH domain-containing protein
LKVGSQIPPSPLDVEEKSTFPTDDTFAKRSHCHRFWALTGGASMAKEIERKFLVKDDGWRAEVTSSSDFIQAYIVTMDDRSLRVRLMDDERASMTLKIGRRLISRDEFEYTIPVADAKELISNALGLVLQKTRYEVEHEGFVWEIDVYAGVYVGLVVAEVEMDDEEQDPALPSWIGKEVTGDPRYSNQMMAAEDMSMELCDGISHTA